MSDDLREKLADLEHKQWQHWTTYILAEIEREMYTNARQDLMDEFRNLKCVHNWRRLMNRGRFSVPGDSTWVDQVLTLLEDENAP